jgi:hypothetical protein
MRVIMVLLAFVAAPLAMGVSQTGSGLPGRSSCTNGNSAGNRSAQGAANAHKGLCAPQDPPPQVLDSDGDGVPDNLDTCPGTAAGTTVDASGCPVQTTPPPPTCAVTTQSAGTVSIDGQVFIDASPWPGLANWCIHVTGPINATAMTDDLGNYAIHGLPSGTYTVCEELQAGWQQTFPSSGPACPAGVGWSFTLNASNASMVWFGNVTAP